MRKPFRYAQKPKQKLRLPPTRPARNVCVLDPRAAECYREMGFNALQCFGPHSHRHHSRKEVLLLVAEGRLEWLDKNHVVAGFPGHTEWRKVKGQTGLGNATIAAMQMRRGGEMRVRRYVEGGLVSPR